mmetsp:Transcript_7977/g.16788  ORF Transcript_7977/g.16788 Transcript_7977/m.16788 type:complete len:119 (-) Transcript_7977:741-1097(-)
MSSNDNNNNNNNSNPTKNKAAAATDKVKVHFVAVGSAPILKRSKFQIGADQPFAAVMNFLRKLLKLNNKNDSNKASALFLYVQSAFVPSPEENVGDLRNAFAVRDELVVHYSIQEAWG